MHLHWQSILGNGIKTNSMAKVKNAGLMVLSMLDNTLMELKRAMENSIGKMELCIVEILMVVGFKEKVLINGTMAEFIMENGKKIK